MDADLKVVPISVTGFITTTTVTWPHIASENRNKNTTPQTYCQNTSCISYHQAFESPYKLFIRIQVLSEAFFFQSSSETKPKHPSAQPLYSSTACLETWTHTWFHELLVEVVPGLFALFQVLLHDLDVSKRTVAFWEARRAPAPAVIVATEQLALRVACHVAEGCLHKTPTQKLWQDILQSWKEKEAHGKVFWIFFRMLLFLNKQTLKESYFILGYF